MLSFLNNKYIKKYIKNYRLLNDISNNHFIYMNYGILNEFNSIPHEYLDRIDNYKVIILCSPITRIDNLPSNKIRCLWLIENFNQSIDNLPLGIEELYLGDKFNQSIDLIPISVKILSLGIEFNQPLYNLPPGLKTLELNSQQFSYSLSNLPASCKTVILYESFDRHINDLPDTVETIIIHNQTGWINKYNHDFQPSTGLQKLIIYHYNGYLDQYEIIKNKISKPAIVQIKIINQCI